MPPSDRRPRQGLTRADLPAELTPDTVRHLGFRVLRQLARPGNGVLDADEQRTFDAALAEVTGRTTSLLEESLRRAQHGGPGNLDPALRRSYERTRRRLAEQARWGRVSLPDLDPGLTAAPDRVDVLAPQDESTPPDGAAEPEPDGASAAPEPADVTGDTTDPDTTPPGPDVTPDTLEQQVEQTSDTLDMLEKIASLQQQQVEHQHSQLLSETRGFFFAFLVSVAVIIAGVAPLVEAEPDARVSIVVWTLVVTALAGVVYALVRAVQGWKKPDPDR